MWTVCCGHGGLLSRKIKQISPFSWGSARIVTEPSSLTFYTHTYICMTSTTNTAVFQQYFFQTHNHTGPLKGLIFQCEGPAHISRVSALKYEYSLGATERCLRISTIFAAGVLWINWHTIGATVSSPSESTPSSTPQTGRRRKKIYISESLQM